MNMLQVLGISLLCGLILGFISGWQVNSWKDASDREAREEAIAEAMLTTAQEIAKIEVKNVTIKQQMETVVRENVVYRNCQHTPDGLLLVNEALSGKSSGNSKLPGTGPSK